MRIFLYRDDYAGGDGIPFGKLLNFDIFFKYPDTIILCFVLKRVQNSKYNIISLYTFWRGERNLQNLGGKSVW